MGSSLSKSGGRSADITKLGLAIACIAIFACSLNTQSAHAGFVESVHTEGMDEGTAHSPPSRIDIYTPTFKAGNGEQNKLLILKIMGVSAVGPNIAAFVIRDTGSPLSVGSGCTAIDANTATCRQVFTTEFDAETGDLDDTVTIGEDYLAYGSMINTGTGNDVIQDGPGPSYLNGGGGGHDQIRGDGGSDKLSDGDTAGDIDSDTLDGGGDSDTVESYANRTNSVHVDLSGGGPAGQTGENDQISNAEGVVGGSAADQLTGAITTDKAAGILTGGGGDDQISAATLAARTNLVGGAGNDTLIGGVGIDQIAGDAGNDQIKSSSGDDEIYAGSGADVINGGAGRDRIEANAGNDMISAGSGNDIVDAGPGHDRVLPGAGTNHIYTRDGESDRISCSRSAKVRTIWLDKYDTVNRFCKRSSITGRPGRFY